MTGTYSRLGSTCFQPTRLGGIVLACAAGLAAAGCGDRDAAWDTPFVKGSAVGLAGSVAVVDQSRNELMMLSSPKAEALALTRLKIGKNIAVALPSVDSKELFVLTRGEARRLRESDEKPQLFRISGGAEPRIDARYELSDSAQKLELDPQGEWAVIYDAGGVVVNSNELTLVDLTDPDPSSATALRHKTIRSTGGQPEHFTFTAPLTLPNGEQHRLLVVETNQDLAIIDLSQPDKPEVTVSLPKTKAGDVAHPATVAFHDDLPADAEVASYLAIAFTNDSSVLSLKLGDSSGKPDSSGISVVPNLLDAGTIPSTVDFVQTDSGLRLAALVPTQSAAVLFDPTSSKSERVQFDHPYSGLARVTGLVSDAPMNADVALLYSSSVAAIAFWRLGDASATPYASFDSYNVDTRVTRVIDIPGAEFGYMKLLVGASDTEFFLLDLQSRQSYPMKALAGFQLRLSPDGQRAWAFPQQGDSFARLRFSDKHPTSFPVERSVVDVFDIQRADGGRSALVLHAAEGLTQDVGVTIFDALEPDSAHTRFVSGLMLEGIR